jgi:hypothetical protein
MAASAEIFCLVMVLPADKSTMAICCAPAADSHTVMNLSDSMEQEPNLTFSAGTESGGFTNYISDIAHERYSKSSTQCTGPPRPQYHKTASHRQNKLGVKDWQGTYVERLGESDGDLRLRHYRKTRTNRYTKVWPERRREVASRQVRRLRQLRDFSLLCFSQLLALSAAQKQQRRQPNEHAHTKNTHKTTWTWFLRSKMRPVHRHMGLATILLARLI